MIIKSLKVKIIWKITKHLSKEFLHCLRYFSSFNSLILSTHLQVRCRRVLHNREKWDSEIKAEETVFRVTKASNSPGGIQASACTIADILANVPPGIPSYQSWNLGKIQSQQQSFAKSSERTTKDLS